MSSELISQIRDGGILYILLVIAITMHEFGHAYAADKLGCVLPRMQGRVSINPLVHMDLMGTVVFPIMCIALAAGTQFPLIFGWGKPVQMVFTNKATFVRDDIVSTLGGSAMNLVVALISAMALALLAAFNLNEYAQVAAYSIMINCVLFVINMLPIPPLDGARVLKHLLKISDALYMSIARYGIFIFFAVIFLPPTKAVLQFVIMFVNGIFFAIASGISALFVK